LTPVSAHVCDSDPAQISFFRKRRFPGNKEVKDPGKNLGG